MMKIFILEERARDWKQGLENFMKVSSTVRGAEAAIIVRNWLRDGQGIDRTRPTPERRDDEDEEKEEEEEEDGGRMLRREAEGGGGG